SLFDGINEGRKFGLCHILSVTSMEALKEKYGDMKARTMIGMCATKINYRCDEPDTAKWLADLYGEEDVQDKKRSLTISDRNDSTNLHDQRSKRHILLPTEFMGLADKISVVKLGSSLPIAKVKVPYIQRADIAKAMILQLDEPELTRPVNNEDDYSLTMMIDTEQSPDKNSTEQAPLL
ncbi:MAG: type IV secretion system DNA-binding domain-containing protein, partial [Aestuariibacter sp.]|nr:type IV secretion system DNA-binding domain-containing protein [Aestuariibacter sp.]